MNHNAERNEESSRLDKRNSSQIIGQELVGVLSNISEDKVDYTKLKPTDLGEGYKTFQLKEGLEKEDKQGKYIILEGQKYREWSGESEVPGQLIYHNFGNSNFEIGLQGEDGWHLKKGLIKYSWTQAVEYAAGEFNSFGLHGQGIKVWRNGNVEKGTFQNGELTKKRRNS